MRIYYFNLKFTAAFLRVLVVITLITCVLFASLRAVFIASATEEASAAPNAAPVIIIDAGHGGEDPGAVGTSGVYEKDLNLAIALMLGEELTGRGYTVIYTRTDDRMLYSEEENIKGFRKLSDLKNRVKIANESENAILISLHMNSFGDARYSGLQTYYKPSDSASEALAQSVQGAVRRDLQAENTRTIKSGKDMYVLENIEGQGILIECGFLTNGEECEKLSQKEYQKQLSFSIACGIIEYIEKTN